MHQNDTPSPLALCTNDEIVKELTRRCDGIIVAMTKDAGEAGYHTKVWLDGDSDLLLVTYLITSKDLISKTQLSTDRFIDGLRRALVTAQNLRGSDNMDF